MTIARPARIAGASGSPADIRSAFVEFASTDEQIDAIVGDFMSEKNMPTLALRKTSVDYSSASPETSAYCANFLDGFIPALPHLAKKKTKVIVNAGACDTEALYHFICSLTVKDYPHLNVAWIEGDQVLDAIEASLSEKNPFSNIYNPDETLKGWVTGLGEEKPIFAQAYLGGWGIKTALDNGADIVICGRVADASPTVGFAAHWHGWRRDEFNKLANALVAGHLIECSTYVCGGNYTGFKSLDWSKIHRIGFPIAEIGSEGEVVITKQTNTGGSVLETTCKEQFLYEIQGPLYYNSDVTAFLPNAKFTQAGEDRVALSGVTGLPPPPTTKAGLTAFGGYRAEFHYLLNSPYIAEKARMLELQARAEWGEERLKSFKHLSFTINGSETLGAPSIAAGISDLRIFAQSKTKEALSPDNFVNVLASMTMQSFPANTFHGDLRQSFPMPFLEYFSTLIPQSLINHQVHLHTGETIDIPPPENTRVYPRQQQSYEAESAVDLELFGETLRAPLGLVVHARSGDKGTNCNVGLFVRHEDEYEWLKSLLSTDRFKTLLRDEYKGGQIDRMEFQNLWAVHFLLHGALDRGCDANATYDTLGKMTAEHVRCQYVDIPKKFLARGDI